MKTKKILKKIYKKYNNNALKVIIVKNFNFLNLLLNINFINTYILKFFKFKKFKGIIKKILKKKILKKKKKFKFKFKKKFKFKFKKKFKSMFLSLKSRKKKINELIFFLKYFSVLRKRQSKIFNLSRVKARLSKKKFFLKKLKTKKFLKYFAKKYRQLHYRKKKYINLINIDLYFIRNKRFFRLHRLYDIRKKYIRYLNNNRNIYKFYKFRIKHNFKFIKRHIKSISALNIKNRIHMYEFSLRNLILKLKYAYTLRNSSMFIKGGFIFLNGLQEFNPFKYVLRGDTIELIYSKFVFKLKNKIKKKLNISMRRFKRYNWKTLKNKVDPEKRKIRISRFSEKILNYKIKLTKLFQFDFRTLSYFMVLDLNCKKDLTYLNKKLLPIYLLKLFNWKVIS